MILKGDRFAFLMAFFRGVNFNENERLGFESGLNLRWENGPFRLHVLFLFCSLFSFLFLFFHLCSFQLSSLEKEWKEKREVRKGGGRLWRKIRRVQGGKRLWRITQASLHRMNSHEICRAEGRKKKMPKKDVKNAERFCSGWPPNTIWIQTWFFLFQRIRNQEQNFYFLLFLLSIDNSVNMTFCRLNLLKNDSLIAAPCIDSFAHTAHWLAYMACLICIWHSGLLPSARMWGGPLRK